MIRILKMTTGEQIVCHITEVSDDAGNGIGFEIKQPYQLQLLPDGEPNEDGSISSFKINYSKWMPCSQSSTFRLPYAAVIAIGELDEQILETYMQKFGDIFNDDNALQPSDSSNTTEDAGVSDIGD
jgi:hypothetical protein